ncbi:MAG: hypothetical protein DMG07_26615 [Acidobacteria bacterium]|nr:MAG: hypothetical protein DMG07_26615 [Acidobacteriota bacterium]
MPSGALRSGPTDVSARGGSVRGPRTRSSWTGTSRRESAASRSMGGSPELSSRSGRREQSVTCACVRAPPASTRRDCGWNRWKRMSRLERLLAVACLLDGVSRGAAAEKPLVVRALPGAEAVPVRLPDGVLQVYYLQTGGERESIAAIASTDGGRTWGPPVTVLPIEGRHRVVRALVADDGEVHLFLLKWRDGHRFLDVWHVRSREGRRRWGEPARIFEGYVGSLRGAAQLRGGRILLPIHYRTDRSWRNRGEGLAGFLYKGQFDITALHTDDGGASWRRSPARLTVPAGAIPDQGGVEPVVLELRDGRIWMLIRSQRGLLYESFSRDGVAWTEPQPSRFVASDSPAALARLRDGRIVVAWNGCQRYPYAMGGRQVLHAAISEDEGKTWRGFRERRLRNRIPRRGRSDGRPSPPCDGTGPVGGLDPGRLRVALRATPG